MQRFLAPALATVFAVVALAVPSAAPAAGASQQIATAIDHAGYSGGSDKVEAVHLHMHHVLNCMVGKNGNGFDASAGNPCEGQGNGALNDATSAATRETLGQVADLMRIGIRVDTLAPAQQIARAAQGILEQAGGM